MNLGRPTEGRKIRQKRPHKGSFAMQTSIKSSSRPDSTMNDWPFREPPHELAITVRQIVQDGASISYIAHDEENGWSFWCDEPPDEADILAVSLEEILKIDPRISFLAYLPTGTCVSRDSPDGVWWRAERLPDPHQRYQKDITLRKNQDESVWTPLQFGLSTLFAMVTIFAVLFSFFATFKIDWLKGLFLSASISLAIWLVVNVFRLINLPKNSKPADDTSTNTASNNDSR
jgi:hypothetical protein